MAIDVRTFYRGSLAGQGLASGGVDSAGASENNKIVVVGDINITTYTAGGEPVTAADLGLDSLDCILLSPVAVDNLATGLPGTSNILVANYDYTNEQVLLWDGAAGTTVAGSLGRVRFAAFGNGPAPELT